MNSYKYSKRRRLLILILKFKTRFKFTPNAECSYLLKLQGAYSSIVAQCLFQEYLNTFLKNAPIARSSLYYLNFTLISSLRLQFQYVESASSFISYRVKNKCKRQFIMFFKKFYTAVQFCI